MNRSLSGLGLGGGSLNVKIAKLTFNLFHHKPRDKVYTELGLDGESVIVTIASAEQSKKIKQVEWWERGGFLPTLSQMWD